MNSPDVRNAIQIDRGSSLAICNEIGDRLRIKLGGEHEPLPQHLTALVDRIAQISSHYAAASSVRETPATQTLVVPSGSDPAC